MNGESSGDSLRGVGGKSATGETNLLADGTRDLNRSPTLWASLKKLPLLPNRRTMHLMAKAAVTVYEAAMENKE